jgi:energy-coupling factor transporter ATP-binding protein EcfA2
VSDVLDLDTIPRAEFLTERWDHSPGEHVTVLGPNGSGKTHLAYQLLETSARPQHPAVVLVMKPRDATARLWSRELEMPITRSWPPATVWRAKPRGWTLWPRHVFDPARDNVMLETQFRRAILDSYKRGSRIVFVDELAGMERELSLKMDTDTLWTRGRSMGTSIWAASQRPAWISGYAFSQAMHLFLFRTPDKRDRERFADISGHVSSKEIEATNLSLPRYHALYIRREPFQMCIVGP